MLTDDFDLVGKGPTDTEVTVGDVVGSVRHVDLLPHHYPILDSEAQTISERPADSGLSIERRTYEVLPSPRR
jgi:hypothetical protein